VRLELSPALDRVLERVNALRVGDGRRAEVALVEELLDALFETRSHLAVYGTLAPGAPNHSVLAEVGGEWIEGRVRGEFVSQGWAATAGFPALRWKPEGDAQPVHLLRSPRLRGEWERLDDFEGAHYRRILVPVESAGELVAVANLYEIGAVP